VLVRALFFLHSRMYRTSEGPHFSVHGKFRFRTFSGIRHPILASPTPVGLHHRTATCAARWRCAIPIATAPTMSHPLRQGSPHLSQQSPPGEEGQARLGRASLLRHGGSHLSQQSAPAEEAPVRRRRVSPARTAHRASPSGRRGVSPDRYGEQPFFASSSALDVHQTKLADVLGHLVHQRAENRPPCALCITVQRTQLTRVCHRQDHISGQQLVSEGKELLREVREHLAPRNATADKYGEYQDVSSPVAAAGRPQSSEVRFIDIRVHPSFLRALASALHKSARDKSGLFDASAAIALSSIVHALALMLCDNVEGQDLAARSSPSVAQALHFVMQSGNKDAVGWAALAMSQIAIRRPETAISM